MGFGGGGKLQQVADHRPEPALVKQRGERPHALAVVLDEHSVEGDVGVQQGIEVQLWHSDRRDLPTGPQGRYDSCREPAADQVGDRVELAARDCDSPCGNIRTGVIDAGDRGDSR